MRVAVDPVLREEVYRQLREYCHQCRNQLNSLKLSIYLATRRTDSPALGQWNEVERSYQDLEARVEQIHFLCRPLALSRVTLGLDLLVDDRRAAWSSKMNEQGGGLTLKPPAERAVVSFDVDAMGKALDSVVTWRASVGPVGRSAQVRWWVAGGQAHLAWEEPAIGRPRPKSSTADGPSAWTLPALAKVIRAHGGDYEIETGRGWRIELRWPSA